MRVESAQTSIIEDDAGAYVDGFKVSVIYTAVEMADLQANYDPASGTSPTVGYCRPTMRAILDAVRAIPQDGGGS
jgi:hypothetical protein